MPTNLPLPGMKQVGKCINLLSTIEQIVLLECVAQAMNSHGTCHPLSLLLRKVARCQPIF